MKTQTVILSLCGATLLAVSSVFLLVRHDPGLVLDPPAGRRTFEVTGKVVKVDTSAKSIRIAHEAIPDYMPAMTMPFTVQRAALLKGLTPGQRVKFRLEVTDDDSWISRIEPEPAASLVGNPAVSPVAETAQVRDLERIQVGEPMPDFSLVNQEGQPVRLSDFRGRAVVLTFIYTRCPLPNFCPLMSKNFASLQERLSQQFGGKFQLLSISIDPDFDQPEVLKSYGLRYGANPKYWTFATGTREQIDAAATLLGLTHEPENGFIAHDLRTALISPEGRLVHVWKSNVWTPYEVERLVRETLTDQATGLAQR